MSNLDELTQLKLDIPCNVHPQNLISHGCCELGSEQEVLFCSECIIDNLEYVQSIRGSILPIQKFFNEFSLKIINAKESLLQFEDMYQYRNTHLNMFNKFLTEQKEIINNQIKEIGEQFLQMLDQVRSRAFNQLNESSIQLKNNYEEFQKYFQTKDVSVMQVSSVQQFLKQISLLEKDQINNYLKQVRQSIQVFKDPRQSKTIQNLQYISNIIKSFPKSSEDHILQLNQFQRQMQVFSNEIGEQILQYAQMVSQPLGQNNTSVFTKTKTRNSSLFQDTDDYSYLQSPRKFNQDYNVKSTVNFEESVFSQRRDVQNNSISVMNNSPQKSILNKSPSRFISDTPRQYTEKHGQIESIIENYSKIHVFAKMVPEAQYYGNEINSAICIAQICPNIVAVAGKDCKIKIFQVVKNVLQTDILLQRTLISKSPLWCMCKLNQNKWQNKNSVLLAAGTENGCILVYQLSTSSDGNQINLNEKIMDTYELNQEDKYDTITQIVDVQGKSQAQIGGHFISGDRSGQIVLWNFQERRIVQSFNVHSKQINSIASYNDGQNFAVGSLDNSISIWEINKSVQQMSLQCIKVFNQQQFFYSIYNLPNSPFLFCSDQNKRVLVLNHQTMKFVNEVGPFQDQTILDFISFIYKTKNDERPMILCFTRQSCVLLDGHDLQLISHFDSSIFLQNNIGFTMSTCSKVVLLNNDKNTLQIALVNQNNKDKKIFSTFKLELQ